MPSKTKGADLNAFPVWYQPGAVFGSAVRHVASLSPKFQWVGIFLLKKKKLKPGPSIGGPMERQGAKSDLIVPVRDRKGRELGQFEIDCLEPAALGPEEEAMVRKIADELGNLWQE